MTEYCFKKLETSILFLFLYIKSEIQIFFKRKACYRRLNRLSDYFSSEECINILCCNMVIVL